MLTNGKGQFEFSSVSPGKYTLTPFLRGQNIHFQPNLLEIDIEHDSVALSTAFEVLQKFPLLKYIFNNVLNYRWLVLISLAKF